MENSILWILKSKKDFEDSNELNFKIQFKSVEFERIEFNMGTCEI